MKTKQEIEKILSNFDDTKNEYTGMTYEQGISEALEWVIGELADDEFSPAQKD